MNEGFSATIKGLQGEEDAQMQAQKIVNRTTDIYIRATAEDVEWLRLSLTLLNRHAMGFRNIILACPGHAIESIINAGVVTREIVNQIEESRSELTWLMAYKYSNAENIILMAPSTIPTEVFNPDLFLDPTGKIRWKASNPVMIKSNDMALFAKFIENKYGVGPQAYFGQFQPFKVTSVLDMFVKETDLRNRYLLIDEKEEKAINDVLRVHSGAITPEVQNLHKRLMSGVDVLFPENPASKILPPVGKAPSGGPDLGSMLQKEQEQREDELKQELSDTIDKEMTPDMKAPYQDVQQPALEDPPAPEPQKPKPRPNIKPVLRDDEEGSEI